MKLVSRMKVARVTRGLTQEELAELTGLPLWRISAIEQGLPPDREQATLLSKALRLPIPKIFPVYERHELWEMICPEVFVEPWESNNE